MKPKPLSSLNHLTVPVAIAFPPASIVLRARRLRGKSYDRWHCDVGRITRPDLATVAVPTDRRSARGRARQASQQAPALDRDLSPTVDDLGSDNTGRVLDSV